MKIYVKIKDGELLNIHTSQIDNDYQELEINTLDEFYEKTNLSREIEGELENQLRELLDPEQENMTLNSFHIKHWVSNRSFGELIDMYESGELKKPAMQREFVWDSLRCSRLIESIILGLPIPPLFLLEVEKNEYEIIDGFQRITTLANFVMERPWHSNSSVRKIPSKLSGKISKEIAGKKFKELDPTYQKTIKRSTIPLIEFKQLDPDNSDSKYLIFERINTGSEKLNSMQIRKSLAYGPFIKSLYKYASKNDNFTKIFSNNGLKKDEHIEAFLRVKVMSEIYFEEYTTEKIGIKNILNEYCEKNKNSEITEEYFLKFNKAMDFCYEIFKESKNMFKRIEMKEDKKIFSGNLNISIMDSFIGILLKKTEIGNPIRILDKYKNSMYQVLENSLISKKNPFTTNTGSLESINERFKICQNIIEELYEVL